MKFIRGSKKAALIGVLGLMAAVLPVSPASATAQADVVTIQAPGGVAGIAECAAVGVTTGGTNMELVVRGTANIAGATNISLVCHVWQGYPYYNHRDIGGVTAGGSAVAAGVAQGFDLAPYNICAEVFIVTLSGSRHFPCPAH